MKGRILAGKYRLVHELGRGGMGSVWRADHIELRSVVAVKLIDPALAQSAEGRSRFLREARAAGALRSNHVVQVYDYGVDDGVPYLVMELLDGESLASRLERQGKLSLGELQTIIKQVGRALAKAHAAGIVHRDLKPENIFICSEGDSEFVKVLDFGIAKVESNIAASVQTQTGLVLGTPYYMSPEQAEGRKALDARSDLWSLGVITYECLLGVRPFEGENLAQLILAICAHEPPLPSQHGVVPPGFDEWFHKAVARRVEVRFANIQELVESFSALDDQRAWESTIGVAAHLGAAAAPTPKALSSSEPGHSGSATGVLGIASNKASRATSTQVGVEHPVAASSTAAHAPNPLPVHQEPTNPAPTNVVSPTSVAANEVPSGTVRHEPGAVTGSGVSAADARKNTPPGREQVAFVATNSLGDTRPGKGAGGKPMGLIVGAATLAFAIAALVVWTLQRPAENPAAIDNPAAVDNPAAITSAMGPVAEATFAVAATSKPHEPTSAATLGAPTRASSRAHHDSEPPRSTSEVVNAAAPNPSLNAASPTASSSATKPRDVIAVAIPSGVANPSREPTNKSAEEKAKPVSGGLHCVAHSISGRLQRVPAGTPSSFPCYVHAISGQLKRKI